MKKLKFIDLFAGAGGLRIPFDELGLINVFSSEIDKFAQKTYEAYFSEIPFGDITKIESSNIPDHDILLAGFPCQPFSQAGLKQGFSDTRGTLFFNIQDILEKKEPKAFLLENVKGLKNHDQGRTFKVITEKLTQLGYSFKTMVLNAKDFGLPQNRERIFIVGFKEFEHNFRFEFPKGLKQVIKLGEILESEPDPKYTISDELWAGHQRRKLEHKEKGNGFGYSLFNKDSYYTNTISARYYKDGSEILIEQVGKNPRKLTPFEASQLQGFPADFVKKAKQIGLSDVQLYKQMGNTDNNYKIFAFSLKLLKLKNFLLEYAKLIDYLTYSQNNLLSDNALLTLERDTFEKYKPYAFRVNGALITLRFFDLLEHKNSNIFISSYSNYFIDSIFKEYQDLKLVGLKIDSIFGIIFQESISQSIKSTAGKNLEDLVELHLTNIGISDIIKKHDKNHTSLEYDHFFEFNNKKFGISTKRTLRERYKQFKKLANAEAEIFIHITSGLDLNEAKAKIITSEEFGCYIFVFPEIYKNNVYLQNNPKVFSTSQLTLETLQTKLNTGI